MQIELKRIQTDVGTTFVHVTHDQEEAMTMADTVAVMNSGRIEQLGHPADIYELPRTVFVANFLGQSNLFQGHKSSLAGDDIVVSAHGQNFSVPQDRCFADGMNIIVGVRPEKMRVLDEVDAHQIPEHHNRVVGRVTDVSYMGVSTQYLIMTPWDQEVIVFEQNVVVGDRSDVGDPVVVHWSPRHTFGLDGSAGTTVGVDPEVLALEALNTGLLDEAPEA
jgi:spermidine/putrescine transport system ATP-binding protein